MDAHQRFWGIFENLKARGKTGFLVMRALWKIGVPERFWIFIFVIAVVAGLGLKAWAHDFITIGHDDYLLLPQERLYDLNARQDVVLSEGGSLTQPDSKQTYPACDINE